MQMVHMLVEDLLQSFPVRLWDIVEESKALAIGRFERIGFSWLSERSRTLTLDGDVAVEVIHVLG
jgi:ribosomal protein S18 acetylase RimI-like enzyme